MDDKVFANDSDLSGAQSTFADDFDFTAGFDSTGSEDTAVTENPTEGDTTPETGTEEPAPAEEANPSETSESAPTTEQGPEDNGKLHFTAKIDHQEQEIDLDPKELPTIYQKAANMDRAVKRATDIENQVAELQGRLSDIASLARVLNFEGDTDEAVIAAMREGLTDGARKSQIDAMVGEGTSQQVAEYIADQRIKEAAQAKQQAVPSAPDESGVPSPEQFSKDLQELLELKPELKNPGTQFPDEVLQAYMGGANLKDAYFRWETTSTAAKNAELEERNAELAKQLKILQQNQASAQRAPVRGVSSGGGAASGQQAEDPYTAGFDDDYWS